MDRAAYAEQALALYAEVREAAATPSEKAEAHLRAGRVCGNILRDLTGAQKHYQTAWETSPASREAAQARWSLAQTYAAAGETPRAIEAYRDLISSVPRDDEFVGLAQGELGQLLLREERTEEALAWLDGVIAQFGDAAPGSAVRRAAEEARLYRLLCDEGCAVHLHLTRTKTLTVKSREAVAGSPAVVSAETRLRVHYLSPVRRGVEMSIGLYKGSAISLPTTAASSPEASGTPIVWRDEVETGPHFGPLGRYTVHSLVSPVLSGAVPEGYRVERAFHPLEEGRGRVTVTVRVSHPQGTVVITPSHSIAIDRATVQPGPAEGKGSNDELAFPISSPHPLQVAFEVRLLNGHSAYYPSVRVETTAGAALPTTTTLDPHYSADLRTDVLTLDSEIPFIVTVSRCEEITRLILEEWSE